MKVYTIIRIENGWSWNPLEEKVVKVLNKKTEEGYEIVSVSFSRGFTNWPIAYITMCK